MVEIYECSKRVILTGLINFSFFDISTVSKYYHLVLLERVDSALPLLLWLFNIRACNDAASPSTGNNSPFDVVWDDGCRGRGAEWDCVSD